MPARTGRATLPRDFITTRRTYRPYRGYSYGRRRTTPSYRDSAFRFITPSSEVELPWLKPRKPKVELPDVPPVELATKLHVTGVDLHINDNVVAHHTDMYNCTDAREVDGKKLEAELVIRRGQEFTFTITFDRPYDIKKNDITFAFKLGEEALGGNVIEKLFKLDETHTEFTDKSKWGAVLKEKKEKSLTVSVFIPAMAEVGEWELGISTIVDVQDGKDIVWQYNHNKGITVLFNPWCKEDLVYLSDETWLKETVLSDSGAVYYGTYRHIGAKKWYFAQFEDVVLDTSLLLLRLVFGFEASPAMGNAVRVVRALSKIVNANDDYGVVIGRWGGDYEGGTKPTSWVGSYNILKEYKKNEAPVRFGQCWVFSGVLTSVCRALGIPCRSVTNFESAHNTDTDHLSCDTINKLVDGEWTSESIDSVWNFHVWNEVWLSRPDLSSAGETDYHGWQVIDATPQETSEGVFQCGPAPLTAIKEGHLLVGDDTPFVFAEVNGDKVEWKEDPDTKMLLQMERKKNAIGKNISTHKPTGEPYKGKGDLERLDLTDQYKYPEGSEKEREIVRAAERMFRWANVDPTTTPAPFEALDITSSTKEFKVGEGLDFQVTVRNTGDVARTVELYLGVDFTNYRGVATETANAIKVPDFQVAPAEEHKASIEIDVMTSLKRPQDGYNFKLHAIAKAKESGNIVIHSSSLRLIEPEIVTAGPTTCKIDDVIEVALTFTNPLPVPMTNCVLYTEGGLKPVEPTTERMDIGDIKEGETWKMTVKLKPAPKPKYKKSRDAAFSLSSYQLGTVDGIFDVELESGST